MSAFGWYRPWLAEAQDSDLSMKAKALAAVLARDERDGTVRRTSAWLGQRCSCDERTVRRASVELAAAGWIARRRSRDHLVITLVTRPDTAPDHAQSGHDARPTTDAESPQTGHDARADRTERPVRPGTGSDIATGPSSSSASLLPAAREYPRQVTQTQQALAELATRHEIPTPTVEEIAAIFDEHPRRDGARALDDVRRWAARSCPRNLAGAFRKALAEAPAARVVQDPDQLRVEPPDDDLRALWQDRREDLRQRTPEATFDVWLAPLDLLGVTPAGEVVLGANEEVAGWVAHRFLGVLGEALERSVIVTNNDEARAAAVASLETA
jgi:hypothetical protein